MNFIKMISNAKYYLMKLVWPGWPGVGDSVVVVITAVVVGSGVVVRSVVVVGVVVTCFLKK